MALAVSCTCQTTTAEISIGSQRKENRGESAPGCPMHVGPDGTYRMRVVRRDESRVIDSVKEIDVDTVPPEVTLASATPNVIPAGLPFTRRQIGE